RLANHGDGHLWHFAARGGDRRLSGGKLAGRTYGLKAVGAAESRLSGNRLCGNNLHRAGLYPVRTDTLVGGGFRRSVWHGGGKGLYFIRAVNWYCVRAGAGFVPLLSGAQRDA